LLLEFPKVLQQFEGEQPDVLERINPDPKEDVGELKSKHF
jgi:hypothetical protein